MPGEEKNAQLNQPVQPPAKQDPVGLAKATVQHRRCMGKGCQFRAIQASIRVVKMDILVPGGDEETRGVPGREGEGRDSVFWRAGELELGCYLWS